MGVDQCGPPGDYRTRWSTLLGWLGRQAGVAVVESCVVPPEYAEVLRTHRSLVVEVVADPDERVRRLAARGSDPMAPRDVGFPTDCEINADKQGLIELRQMLASSVEASFA
jgi:hypothetical protein